MGTQRVPLPPLGSDRRERANGLASGGVHLFHRLSLRPLGTLDDLKFDPIPFIQGPKAGGVNGGVVHKDIRPMVLGDEPEPFLLVKPLDGSLRHDHILLTGLKARTARHDWPTRPEKTPCRSYSSGGGIRAAWQHTTRRADEPAGVSIAALLLARATATRLVRPHSPALHTYGSFHIWRAAAGLSRGDPVPLSGFPSAGDLGRDSGVGVGRFAAGWPSPGPAGDPLRWSARRSRRRRPSGP
jgi:hypothetical protein